MLIFFLGGFSLGVAVLQDAAPAIFPVSEDSGPIDVRGADGSAQQWFATRLVDAQTGAALRGRISAYVEHMHPEPPTWAPLRTAESDPEGWIRLRIDDLLDESGLWMVAEADGYAPATEMTAFPPLPWEMERAVDIPLEVRDAFGRPVAQARIGWHLGCGHTPDVRQALTDAQGRTTLKSALGTRGELWIHAPGLRGRYADLGAWQPPFPRVVIHRDPAPTWRGVVLDAERKPRAGVHVGLAEYHRGPWARTDAEGRFVLEGLEDDGVMVADESNGQEIFFDMPPPGVEARLVLPKPGEDLPELSRPEDENLKLEIEAPGGGEGDEIPITAWCAALHFVEHDDAEPGAVYAAALPPGHYEIRAGGERSAWKEQRTTVEVPASGAVSAKLRLEPRTRVKMWLDPRSPFALQLEDAGAIELVTATWSRSIEAEVRAGRRIAVPDGEEWAVRLQVFDRVHHVPSSAVDEKGELVLEAPEPYRVRVRFADAEGRPRRGVARVGKHPKGRSEYTDQSHWSGEESSVELLTWLGPGRWLLLVESKEPAWRAPREPLHVDLPETTQAVVDAGTIRFRPALPRGFVLRKPDGSPAAKAELEWNEEVAELDEQGRLPEGLCAASGDVVIADLEDGITVPLRTTLEGAGPWEIAWPKGELELAVQDERGEPVPSFVLHLDGKIHSGQAGRLTLRGLPLGAREGIVAAEGFAPQRVKLDLAPTARAEVQLAAR